MPLPVHNVVWSVVSMARTMRENIDDSKEHTTVLTSSLALLLDTFIAEATNTPVADGVTKSVSGKLSDFNRLMTEAEKLQAEMNRFGQ